MFRSSIVNIRRRPNIGQQAPRVIARNHGATTSDATQSASAA
jgi:hypothetical protein